MLLPPKAPLHGVHEKESCPLSLPLSHTARSLTQLALLVGSASVPQGAREQLPAFLPFNLTNPCNIILFIVKLSQAENMPYKQTFLVIGRGDYNNDKKNRY